MIRLLKLFVMLVLVYSAGFISGMRYQGGEDEAEALKQDLLEKKEYIKQTGQTVFDKIIEE